MSARHQPALLWVFTSVVSCELYDTALVTSGETEACGLALGGQELLSARVRLALKSDGNDSKNLHSSVHFAKASCPFSILPFDPDNNSLRWRL